MSDSSFLVTKEWLRDMGYCQPQIDLFNQLYPEGVTVLDFDAEKAIFAGLCFYFAFDDLTGYPRDYDVAKEAWREVYWKIERTVFGIGSEDMKDFFLNAGNARRSEQVRAKILKYPEAVDVIKNFANWAKEYLLDSL